MSRGGARPSRRRDPVQLDHDDHVGTLHNHADEVDAVALRGSRHLSDLLGVQRERLLAQRGPLGVQAQKGLLGVRALLQENPEGHGRFSRAYVQANFEHLLQQEQINDIGLTMGNMLEPALLVYWRTWLRGMLRRVPG